MSLRSRWSLAVVAVLAACGPDARPSQSCAGQPDFVLDISAVSGALPSDVLVSVRYGGDRLETYSPSALNQREVLFCAVRSVASGAGGAAGAGGAGDDAGAAGATSAGGAGNTIGSIACELWTGGPALVDVSAGDLESSLALNPETNLCTVSASIVLGQPKSSP